MPHDMAIPAFYHLDLCSGSGMLGEAVRFALDGGIRTVAYVERETYAASAIVARMDDEALDRAPVWDDISTATDSGFLGYIRRFDPARIIITAGYPCQPFSVAGRRAGVNDERHLWPRIDELIGEIEPGIVFLENVAGHLRLGFAEVRRNLEGRGYRVAAGLFSAAEVGASHRRERLFILAVRETKYELQPDRQGGEPADSGWAMADAREQGRIHAQYGEPLADPDGGGMADTTAERFQPGIKGVEAGGQTWGLRSKTLADTDDGRHELPLFAPSPNARDEWRRILDARTDLAPSAKPDVCGVPNGLASGLDADRLRITGNGVVPLAAAYAFVTLAACLAEQD